ncbi:Amino-acid acetyltransferase, mitochondrial [Elasticomyces elasticus]|nr:Amino-acid acetyltransferase, mitochondrial [Elasticomyces elasticus]
MITSMWAFGKANAVEALKPGTLAKTISYPQFRRSYAGQTSIPHLNNSGNGKPARDDPTAQRELFMDVLSANATRRDAKQYLSRFKPATARTSDVQGNRNARHRHDQDRLDRMGVNLGGLYVPARAIADAPQFEREANDEKTRGDLQSELHVALVCLRAPETIDDGTLDGLATTLSQLVKLDMRIVVVLELATDLTEGSIRNRRAAIAEQAERLARAIGSHSADAARFVTGSLEAADDREVKVYVPKLIIDPIKRGVIPIIPSLAHTATGQLVIADTGAVMAGLTKALHQEANPADARSAYVSIDRIILLDPVGGIPAKHRSDNAHVFINLKQEYPGIAKELEQYASWDDGVSRPNMFDQHTANLRTMNECLRILPAASSGLIISPYEAATSSCSSEAQDSNIGTGTRRQKNTLIHNLLTNKPMVSSSLPAARMSSPDSDAPPAAAVPTATLVKRGMPVSIFPTVHRGQGWLKPALSVSTLELDKDPRIDLPRLVHLIDDSFRRKLDAKHYLDRIRGQTAGVIIAGEYEGAAILTWESPPHSNSDGTRLVPYLDKFAVLQSSQGSSGVADILFQAMVRSCFPQGVCWRSRSDNPVNKWYFERCAGSWRIPDSQWTMFWTGSGVVDGSERWSDYVAACRNVVPSWADGKKAD